MFKADRTEIEPVTIRSRLLAETGGAVAHGFFTRMGGASGGIYSGLNVGLGSRDDPETVRANRAAAAATLDVGAKALVTPHQTHSTDVVLVREPWEESAQPRADAVVTDRPGIAIGILTADCCPILLADGEAGVIAAAHAGWKGALHGIVENTIDEMIRIGAHRSHIVAALGPTISGANYETGPEFAERFLAHDPANHRFFVEAERAGHALFDLPAYVLDRLRRARIACQWVEECTYADEERYFSYRRATHRNEPDYGRQLSAIAIGGTAHGPALQQNRI